MDCDSSHFYSQTADWNVVSLATRYVNVVDDPSRLRTRDGRQLDPALRGYQITEVPAHEASRRFPGLAAARLGASGKQRIALLLDPETGEPAQAADGTPVILPPTRGTDPGVANMVSWRADTGVVLQTGGPPESFLTVLGAAFPEVNVIRLDMNAETLDNPQRASDWRAFAELAAKHGYGLIIQNSDGELAGGFLSDGVPRKSHKLGPRDIGPANALRNPSARGDWKINDVRDDWDVMLKWFRKPENNHILDAVVGWELINEPMAYGRSPKAGKIYAQHMHDLILDLDWGGKRILVGGLGASAQFSRIDLAPIRQAAGDKLIWSVHMYPGWVAADVPDPAGQRFHGAICKGIGALKQPGNDILLTETHLQSSPSLLDPGTQDPDVAPSYNLAREFPWFADNGIGLSWWTPVGRRSSFLIPEKGDAGQWSVLLDLAAFAHWGWIRDETAPRPGAEEHYGTAGADRVTLASGTGLVEGANIATPHGLFFALDGDDQIIGSDLPDLIYGGSANDSISGGDGGDYLFGDQGDDTLDGQGGDDVLIDSEGQNLLTGGKGNDHLEGSGTLDGGAGNDLLIAVPGTQQMTGGPGKDRFIPGQQGKVEVTDFQSDQDSIDLSVLAAQKPRPTVEAVSQNGGITISAGETTMRLTDATGLACGDFRNGKALAVTIDGKRCD
ncbi:cellulase family glycosylhydrolase [Paracoccus sp. NGMCC 1.201697]|uniref:Cellulase family glycosylhydrolase n=1 Tax=Paracoccus broussonetiae subsp. drimophilus TaxID=3373869 RepID=A0ABW7LIU6_9RHOB